MHSARHQVDIQHRGLLELLSRAASHVDSSPEASHKLLEQLHSKLLKHCDSEELLLDRLPVEPGHALAHHQDHCAILREVSRIKGLLEAGEATVGDELLASVQQRIRRHETEFDAQYFAYLS